MSPDNRTRHLPSSGVDAEERIELPEYQGTLRHIAGSLPKEVALAMLKECKAIDLGEVQAATKTPSWRRSCLMSIVILGCFFGLMVFASVG